MFGEAESESPRVPSPWDSFIESSSPPSPGPIQAQGSVRTPSPLSKELIPRLVPESDDGNVEYKLQLLNPSPARFARLVTQMKWRLLEGGGQAYYELGVADSGELIGLPRDELEQSLETLEMMAGEIGASVIVVKEIEVPANFATMAKRNGEWAMSGSFRENGKSASSLDGGYSTPYTTETEQDSLSGTDFDASGDDGEDLSLTVVLDKDPSQTSSSNITSSSSTTTLAGEIDDPGEHADDERLSLRSKTFRIDLEISQVFKPRPMLARMHHPSHHPAGSKSKRNKKHPHSNGATGASKSTTATKMEQNYHNNKSQNRRHTRDKRREEKRKALEARAADALESDVTSGAQTAIDADSLTLSLNGLALVEEPKPDIPTVVIEPAPVFDTIDVEDPIEDDDDDVFGSPITTAPLFPTFSALTTGESHLDVDTTAIGIVGALTAEGGKEETRLIVEALVVRKMSIEEGFLDFGGFQMI
ncbi:hypothetical protein CVT24_001639 [Panaeolus cyanescens]|uniref:Uncharacterized protein n=1 Tax=Panaeolus cyanescens TaxID=181874 RepID=A0A409VSX8_9AGAR|nr:hypothetical protein CVT24_001639 [Panaeolus cyanescens]